MPRGYSKKMVKSKPSATSKYIKTAGKVVRDNLKQTAGDFRRGIKKVVDFNVPKAVKSAYGALKQH